MSLKKCLVIVNLSLFSVSVFSTASWALTASYTLNSLSGSITENFNTLPGSATATNLSSLAGTTDALPGLTPTWYARISDNGSTGTRFVSDEGTDTIGGIHDYGKSATASDRALGSIASATARFVTFGTGIRNNTGSVITSFSVAYNREQYRSATNTANVSGFYYKIFNADAGDIGADTAGTATGPIGTANGVTADSSWTRVSSLDMVGDAPVTTNGVLGTVSSTSVTGTVTLSGPGLANGQDVWIRWIDANDNGNDAALAVDDLTITSFQPVPAPPAALSLGIGGLVGLLGTCVRRLGKHRRTSVQQ